jgi:hypothetical protein
MTTRYRGHLDRINKRNPRRDRSSKHSTTNPPTDPSTCPGSPKNKFPKIFNIPKLFTFPFFVHVDPLQPQFIILVNTSIRSSSSRRTVPTYRSAIAFARGARRMRMPRWRRRHRRHQ